MRPLIPLRAIVDLNLAARLAEQNIMEATSGLPVLQEMYLRDIRKKEQAALDALDALEKTYRRLAHMASEARNTDHLEDLLAEAGIK